MAPLFKSKPMPKSDVTLTNVEGDVLKPLKPITIPGFDPEAHMALLNEADLIDHTDASTVEGHKLVPISKLARS